MLETELGSDFIRYWFSLCMLNYDSDKVSASLG